MKKTAILFLLLSVFAAASAATRPFIVPEPAQYVEGKGNYRMPSVITVSGDMTTEAMQYLEYEGFATRKTFIGKGVLQAVQDSTLSEEQYTLEVTPDGIRAMAATPKGMMYAMSSLRQLADAGKGRVASCTINDYPRFGYRGLMLDVVRCYIPLAEIKKFVDAAASLKINNLHLHLTDDNGWRLEIKKYPKLTEVGAWRVARPEIFPGRLNARSADEKATEGGFYTQDEMRELVKYAADRNVNIIPEIEMPAHSAAAIASYPELACSVVDKFVGVFPGIGGKDASIIMCGGKENTYQFLQDVLDEVMDIFPSKNIHLGGDEANKAVWEKCPECNAKIEAEHLDGHEGLQAYLMDRINHYVRSKGRTAMGWDEVTYGNPKEDMIIYGWQGDGGVAVRDSRKSGRKFILTPAKTMYLIRYQGPQWFEPFTYFGNNTLADIYNYEPVGKDWDAALKSNLMGVQGSLWAEFCKTPSDIQYLVFPRLVAVADVAWRQEGRRNWPQFLAALDNYVPNLSKRGITYARSMYNLDHVVRGKDGKLNVKMSCIRPDMEVRYTIDNTDMKAAVKLPDTLNIAKSGTVRAATFKNGKQVGMTLGLKLDFNKATTRPVSSNNCKNGLAYTLTNGLRGSNRNSDFEWAGWWNETAEFVVDLGKIEHISQILLGNLVHTDICVAAPRTIYVYTSDNGTSYTLQRTLNFDDDVVFHKSAKVQDIDCSVDANARYVKIVAVNPGCIPDGLAREGAATWMYFDEIMIN